MTERAVFPTLNGYAPAQGPKALPLSIDFTSISSITYDFEREFSGGHIDFFQSVYVDNSKNSNPLTLFFDITGQVLVIPATAQGMWPVIAPQGCRLTVSTTSSAIVVNIILMNVPMPISQWGPVTVNATVNPGIVTGTFTDRSGTITLGNSSQQLMAANPARKGMIIYNPASAVESLFIDFGTAAVVGSPSLEIPPGVTWSSGAGPVSTQAVNIIAATTAHAFTAKEM